MKELSIEEKVKRYDEALEKAKNYHSPETECNVRIAMENLFPELKESEDERIRKVIADIVRAQPSDSLFNGTKEKCLAWLEKQGEHANFINKIQIGDKVTRNEAGVLVNLSQLERIAKKDEKQGEQKLTEWHREDEQNLNTCLGYIPDEFLRRWLTDAIHVKYDKPAWSEVDESLRLRTIGALETCKIGYPTKCVDEQINWLKSLRPQSAWRPSERQKEALLWCVVHLGGADKQTLGELLEELNKL